jgi:PAS domain-containing protein/class 3 adenylate cyclase
MNSVISGICLTSLIIQLLMIVRFFGIDIPSIAMWPIVIFVLIATIASSIPFFKLKVDRIAQLLSYSSIVEVGERPTESQKRSYFESLHFRNTQDIFTYMRVGVARNCDLFLDFSFPHFIVDTFPVQEMFLGVGHMLSLFPTELQFLGGCQAQVHASWRLTVADHFLYFQLQKVFVMRQSSVSKEASSMIKKIRKESRDATASIRNFWVDIVTNPLILDMSSLQAIYRLGNAIQGRFRDLCDRFANSQDLCCEYATFLVEGMADYSASLSWRRKASLLEQGIRLNNDYAFHALVNMYPHYLLDRITDDAGRFLSGQRSLDNASQGSAIDEKADASSISDAGTRIAMQRALSRMSLTGLSCLEFVVCLQVAIVAIVGIAIGASVPSISRNVTEYLNSVDLISEAYEGIITAVFAGGISFATHPETLRANYGFRGIDAIIEVANAPRDAAFATLSRPALTTWQRSRSAKRALQDALAGMVLFRSEAGGIVDTLVFAQTMVLYVSDDTAWLTGMGTLRSARAALYEGLDECAGGASLLYHGDLGQRSRARIFAGALALILATDVPTAAQEQVIESGELLLLGISSSFVRAAVAMPVLFFVLFTSVQAVGIIWFYRDVDYALTIMRHVRPSAVEASLLPISRGVHEKVNAGASKLARGGGAGFAALPYVTAFAIVVDCLGFSLGFLLADKKLSLTDELLNWYVLAAGRLGGVVWLPGALMVLPHEGGAVDLLGAIAAAYEAYELGRTALLVGNGRMDGITGFDEALDEAQLLDFCDDPPDDFYSFASCLSIDRACSMVASLARPILESRSPFLLDTDEFAKLMTIVDGSLAQRLNDYDDQLLAFAHEQFDGVTEILLYTSVITVVANVAMLAVMVSLFVSFGHAVEAMRQLIGLLSPIDIASYPRLVDLISGGSDDKGMVAASEIIVREGDEGVLLVTGDYTIEGANQSFYSISGLSADEVLGHPVTVLGDKPQLYELLEKVKTREVRGVQRLQIVNLAVMIVPAYDTDDRVKTFTLVMRDLTQLAASEDEARALKDRCQQILEKAVPKEVFWSRKPSFVTNVGTVLRVEPVGLRECVSAMSPSQVMEALGTVFDAFAEAIAKYPAVHCVQWTEEAIVACCGVFDFATEIREQADQAARACLEFAAMREEINDKCVLDLQFRCAIVLGGPIVGASLDQVTPNFDLMGDVVRLSEVMCRETEPGTIRINAELQDALDGISFVTQRIPKGPKEVMDTILLTGCRD